MIRIGCVFNVYTSVQLEIYLKQSLAPEYCMTINQICVQMSIPDSFSQVPPETPPHTMSLHGDVGGHLIGDLGAMLLPPYATAASPAMAAASTHRRLVKEWFFIINLLCICEESFTSRHRQRTCPHCWIVFVKCE